MNILSESEDEASDNELYIDEYIDYFSYFEDLGVDLRSLSQLNNVQFDKCLSDLEVMYTNTVNSILKLYEGSTKSDKSDPWNSYSNAVENLSGIFKFSKTKQLLFSKSSYEEGKSKFQYNLIKKVPTRNGIWNCRIPHGYLLSTLTKNADCKYANLTPSVNNNINNNKKKPLNRKRKRRIKSKLPLHYDSPNYSPGRTSSDEDEDDVEDKLDREIKLRRCDSSSWRTG